MSNIEAIKLEETWAIMSMKIHSVNWHVSNVTFSTIFQRYWAIHLSGHDFVLAFRVFRFSLIN